MRYGELSETRKRQIRYGALALAVLILAVGLVVFTHGAEHTTAAAPPAGTGAHSSAASPTMTAQATAQATSGDEVTVVDTLRRDEAVVLIGTARRQAAAGSFTEAEASLDKAEKVVPKLAETQQARADIARLKTPEGQLAAQLQRARLAIDHDDGALAETALTEAARLKPDAPEITELRAALKTAHDKKARRDARITEALTRMHDALGRRDYAAADSALNDAERIDLQDPAIRSARRELAQARGAARNTSE